MMIRMNAKCCLLKCLTELKKWLVLVAFTFRSNHSPFGGDLIRVELAIDHAISFEAQSEIDFIGRHGLEVSSPIHIRERIPCAALTRNGFVKDVRRELRRTFKLHVLNPVRNAGVPWNLISGTNPIPHP